MNAEFERAAYQIFDRLLQAPDVERGGLLEDLCDGDAELRAKVESLLEATDQVGDFIEEPLMSLRPPESEDLSRGEPIGRYEIVEKLQRGGMGAVYLARHVDPEFQIRVAVKLVRPDRLSDDAMRRFEDEQKILARLEHPNIIRPLDRGTTRGGFPYLVMEYVDGQRLDRYCEARKLSIEERIEIFRKICSAVHCAHNHLIVHRDLKPSNVLVTPDGEPKLLDFGIARLASSGALGTDDETLRRQTAVGFLGTLRYASPEQVRNEAGLHTASDVYSLGVLLYELLTGHHPFYKWSGSFLDLGKAICEREPEKPSTAIEATEEIEAEDGSTVTLTPEQVCAARRGSAATLKRRLSGDLDSILLKALRKEPGARYASAAALSEDLGRYLDGMPVEARESTMLYQAGKFVRRHTKAVATAAGFLVLIVVFGVWMWFAWEREREARQSLDRSLEVSDFLNGLYLIENPGEGSEITARRVLERGVGALERLEEAETLDESLREVMPDDLPGLMEAVGWAFYGLGDAEAARGWLERSLAGSAGRDPVERVTAQLRLAAAFETLDDGAGAETLRRAALDAIDGESPADRRLAHFLNELAHSSKRRGFFDSSLELYDRALVLAERVYGSDSATVGIGHGNRAEVLLRLGRYDAAIADFRRSLEIREARYGPGSNAVALAQSGLASTLRELGDLRPEDRDDLWREAETLYRQSLDSRRERYGADDPRLARGTYSLALLLQLRGSLEEAGALYDQAEALFAEDFGVDSYQVGAVRRYRATLLQEQGRYEAAAAEARAAYDLIRAALGPDHWRTADAASVLGGCLTDLERLDQAEPMLRDALAALEADLGSESRITREARERLRRFETLRFAERR